MSEWDVSRVDDFSGVFDRQRNDRLWRHVHFGDLSGWDVSNGTNFSYMFRGCENFRGGAVLSLWNVGRGNSFKGMFSGCIFFQGDVSHWNVSQGTNFHTTCFYAAFFF
jgi:Mycoplasma protein of unknown function, DUF285